MLKHPATATTTAIAIAMGVLVATAGALTIPNPAAAQTAEEYFKFGNAKYDLGLHKQAISDFDEVIKLTPDDDAAYNNRGNAKLRIGDYESAIEDYNKAIELNPGNAAAYDNRGVAKYAIGLHEEAIKDYGKSIELNPANAATYHHRGNANRALELEKEAQYEFGGVGSYSSVRNSFDERSRFAVSETEAAARRTPTIGGGESILLLVFLVVVIILVTVGVGSVYMRKRAHYLHGINEAKHGHYEEAIHDFDETIQIKPDDADAYRNKGIAEARLHRYKEGVADVRHALIILERRMKEHPRDRRARKNWKRARNALDVIEHAAKSHK